MKNLLPTNDVLFKMIFGDNRHSRILIHFLNSVIKSNHPIRKVDIKKNEITPKNINLKGVRLDIIATTDNNEIVNIEMQKKDEKDMISRSLFYWAKLFSGQLDVSEQYSSLNRTISINILDFSLFKNDDRFWRKGYIKDEETGERFTNMLEMHFIELNKMRKVREDSPITFWIEFFRDPYSEKVRSLCKFVPEIREAKDIFEKAKSDPEAQELIRIQEKATRDYASDIAGAKQEGIDEGRKEGREEGIEVERKKNAINMKSKGFDSKLISECLNITESEVEELLK